MNKPSFVTILLLLTAIASGCGAKPVHQEAQSFAMAQSVQSAPDAFTTPGPSAPEATTANEKRNSVEATAQKAEKPSAPPSPTATPAQTSSQSSAVTPSQSPSQSPAQTPAAAPTETPAGSRSTPIMSVSQAPAPAAAAAAPATTATPAAVPKTSNGNNIAWSEFFDDEKQNTPSNKFWDLQDQTVQINGFMGEVLSFEKHWFLLIPQPGAECPFDNGDETYWNKIMIVFVPDSEKLRFTPGPLRITGRLDVGIKVDESGYKTMFRLYDAKVEKIKE